MLKIVFCVWFICRGLVGFVEIYFMLIFLFCFMLDWLKFVLVFSMFFIRFCYRVFDRCRLMNPGFVILVDLICGFIVRFWINSFVILCGFICVGFVNIIVVFVVIFLWVVFCGGLIVILLKFSLWGKEFLDSMVCRLLIISLWIWEKRFIGLFFLFLCGFIIFMVCVNGNKLLLFFVSCFVYMSWILWVIVFIF